MNISEQLIYWYQSNKRDLPWRGIKDPYKIWISEIILQQTRVNQGWEYYNRFVNRFPDVLTLADAEQEEVLKYWQGLGYYSRARNLHAAAVSIKNQFNGIFPKEYKDVLSLKGVGEYTAAAIISFAWNQPYPVVDGNVFRFLSRLLGISNPIDTGTGKKLFTEIAGELMDKKQAGIFNQAIMEFGALQCVPASPNCGICPFSDTCIAFNSNSVDKYPVKQNKVKTKIRYFHYFEIHFQGYTYLRQRTAKDIWQNLYEFPCIETSESMDFAALSQTDEFKTLFPEQDLISCKMVVSAKKHILTHRILYANFYQVELTQDLNLLSSCKKILVTDLDNFPIHRLMEGYLENK